MTSWPSVVLAWTTCAGATGAAVAAALVAQSAMLPQATGRLADVLVIATTTAVGATVWTLRPHHRVASVLLVGGVAWAFGSLVLELANAEIRVQPSTGWAAAALIGLVLRGFGWLALVTQLPLMLPDGRGPTGCGLRVQRTGAVGGLLFLAAMVMASDLRFDTRLSGVANPFGVSAMTQPAIDMLALVGVALVLLPLLAGTGHAVFRWRSGDQLTRQRVAWLAIPVVLTLAAFAGSVAGVESAVLFPVAVAAFPLAIGVAVLQDRLYDVSLIANRALLYGTLTGVLLALYVLVVAGVGGFLGARGAAWLPPLAAVVVALVFWPARDALQRAVNRLTYGSWDEPARVVTEVSARLSKAADPTRVLTDAVLATASALRLEYVALNDAAGRVVVERGDPTLRRTALALRTGGQHTGTLVVAAPRNRPADVALLETIAGQLAPVLHAQRLEDDLRRSREALVLAREEERRRLRRDLHDGLGSALAGLALKVDALRNLIGADDPRGDRLLEIRDDARSAVTEVRRIVEDLRPPALDDLGLPGALQSWADRAGLGLKVDVQVGNVGQLPAGVEVAVYRIVQEAMANAARHSGGRMCSVRVSRQAHELLLTVDDDGCGLEQGRSGGNGLATMQERAEELRGTLSVQARPDGGTRVSARLPSPLHGAP